MLLYKKKATHRLQTSFAWFPTKMSSGEVIWLESYSYCLTTSGGMSLHYERLKK